MSALYADAHTLITDEHDPLTCHCLDCHVHGSHQPNEPVTPPN